MKRTLITSALLVCAAAHAQFPRSVPDEAAVPRGAQTYAKDCAKCHGDNARGKDAAPDLLRSTAVLHDRREMLHGAELGPAVKAIPGHSFAYDAKQWDDLSQFLVRSVNGILRSGYSNQPTNMLSGDATAGAAYFNGTGGCAGCHTVSGTAAHSLAGIGTRLAPAALQQKFLFPNSGVGARPKIQITVAQPGAPSITGDMVRMDDFTVALTDKTGTFHSFNRSPTTKITTTNPYDAHNALLDHYTDAEIHNLTAYLVTLK